MTKPISLQLKGLEKVVKDISKIESRLKSAGPAFKIIGMKGVKDVVSHFEDTKSPKGSWKKLKKPRKDGSDKPLNDTGDLKRRTSSREYKDKAIIFNNLDYAAIHNYGGYAGRGGKVKIPQREFLWMSKETLKSMAESFSRYIVNGRA